MLLFITFTSCKFPIFCFSFFYADIECVVSHCDNNININKAQNIIQFVIAMKCDQFLSWGILSAIFIKPQFALLLNFFFFGGLRWCIIVIFFFDFIFISFFSRRIKIKRKRITLLGTYSIHTIFFAFILFFLPAKWQLWKRVELPRTMNNNFYEPASNTPTKRTKKAHTHEMSIADKFNSISWYFE